MAHAITVRSDNYAEMAYVGAKPWHSLGQELTDGASIETWLTAAGMDWSIERSRVRFATGENQSGAEYTAWDDYHVLMRSDTKAPLGMVSDTFQVVQPSDVLEFFRDLVEAAGFKLSTAGTLHGGRKFWALADMGAKDRIVGNDMVRANLLLATACDGTMRTIAKNVTERVVCANTLAIAMGEKGARQVGVSHRSVFDAVAVKRQMGLELNAFARFIEQARELAKRSVSPTEAEVFAAAMVGKTDLEEAYEMRGYQQIISLFDGSGKGSLMPGVKGTAWGLVNAVTEYVDHHVRARSAANRMDSAWFGAGDDLKQDAMNKAVALLAA